MKVKNNYNRCEVIPYLVFFGLILIRHCFIDANFGDDLWFSTVLNDKTLGTYLHWRYTTWSSRLIVEMILIFFAEKNIWLWRIADSLVFLLLMYSLSEVFIEKGINVNLKVSHFYSKRLLESEPLKKYSE